MEPHLSGSSLSPSRPPHQPIGINNLTGVESTNLNTLSPSVLLSSQPLPSPTVIPASTLPPLFQYDGGASPSEDEDDGNDDDEDEGSNKKKRKLGTSAGTSGNLAKGKKVIEEVNPRRKIEIGFIAKKEKRHITFSKRKAGIMKKVS